MKTLLVTLATLVTAFFGVAQAGEFTCPAGITKGMSYHLARGKLIDAGFLPVPYPDEPYSGSQAMLYLGYIELHGVSQGNAYGTYAWQRKNGKQFSVVTKYNESERPPVFECNTAIH